MGIPLQINCSDLRIWWRHQLEIFSALLVLCVVNSPVTGELPSQRPVIADEGHYIYPITLSAWISNHMHINVWDIITHPLLDSNGGGPRIRAWISRNILHKNVDVITSPFHHVKSYQMGDQMEWGSYPVAVMATKIMSTFWAMEVSHKCLGRQISYRPVQISNQAITWTNVDLSIINGVL